MKYGFVYIWRDKKHKRYYVGCRWGTEDDGYICSSSWMKASYKKRPEDFKRRILARVYTNRTDLLEEEYKWLSMTKQEELHGTRYYNIKNHHFSHWSTDKQKSLSIGQKISKANKGKPGYWLNKEKTKEHKQKISNTLKGRPLSYTRTQETRDKISENSKRLQKEGKIGMIGKHHNEETILKISEAQQGDKNHFYGKNHTIETREKISAAGRGRVLTEESRLKISNKNKGRKLTKEHIAKSHTPAVNEKRSKKLKGHSVTEETREKMKIARLAYVARMKGI